MQQPQFVYYSVFSQSLFLSFHKSNLLYLNIHIFLSSSNTFRPKRIFLFPKRHNILLIHKSKVAFLIYKRGEAFFYLPLKHLFE
ncbi:hypothetical protein K7X08_020200 [Anisodus acutangulus]|uniref:Uncharacterized protein n=1 Tax=Anisodus acutangulus TaxID=402998 RepID=A0A9Q1M887_9SOLA|nr:hypothetical protein K7X08_020200 [Anisodus acutangulus]